MPAGNRSGPITQFAALRRYFADIRGTADDVLEVVRQMDLDPHIATAVETLRRAGWGVIVTSAGCEWSIHQLLSTAGVAVPASANPGRFEGGTGLGMEMLPNSVYLSESLGVDRTAIVRYHVAMGGRVVFAGDGFPEIEPAQHRIRRHIGDRHA